MTLPHLVLGLVGLLALAAVAMGGAVLHEQRRTLDDGWPPTDDGEPP